MISECAIESEVMAHWEHFFGLHADFGVGQGKLLCEFPNSWRGIVTERVHELAESGVNTPMQTKLILEQIDIYNPGAFLRALVPSLRKFKKDSNWCTAAREIHPEFDLLIHLAEPESEKEFKAGEFIKTSGKYVTPRQDEIQRKAEVLIDCGWQLYRRAGEIYVIDPYFTPDESRTFGSVLSELLDRVKHNGRKPKRIEVHTKLPPVYYPDTQKGNWKRWAEKAKVPEDWPITVVHWDKLETGSEMHARYILTNFGGLDYNWGTDEDPKDYTQVSLLDDLFWQKMYYRFAWTADTIPQVFRDHPDRVFEVPR